MVHNQKQQKSGCLEDTHSNAAFLPEGRILIHKNRVSQIQGAIIPAIPVLFSAQFFPSEFGMIGYKSRKYVTAFNTLRDKI
jgi:hypothetical protein